MGGLAGAGVSQQRDEQGGCGTVKGWGTVWGEGALSSVGARRAEAGEAGGRAERAGRNSRLSGQAHSVFRGLESIVISFKNLKEKVNIQVKEKKVTP